METTNKKEQSQACLSHAEREGVRQGQTTNNITRLLEMLDNPDAYTEQEICDIINSDDETRETYRFMVAAKQGYRHKRQTQPADAEEAWLRFERKVKNERVKSKKYKSPTLAEKVQSSKRKSYFSLFTHILFTHKVAAIFIAAAFLGGLAYAAYRVLVPQEVQQRTEVTASSLTGRAGGESALVLFADVRLDSLLSVVAEHYGKTVFFGNEDLKGLRIHTKWNPKDSLEAFMESLNELDGLKLTEQRDTIFVQKGGVQ